MQHARNMLCSSTTRARVARLLATAGLLLGSGAMSACNGDESATSAIEDAQRTLASIHIGGAPATNEQHREERFAMVVNTLRPVADSGTDGQRAAARALLAQAQAGQAAILLERAHSMERESMAEAARIRSAFEHLVVGLRAQAEAASNGNTASDQQEAIAEARRIESERANAQSRLTTLRNEIDSLRQQTSTAESAAAAARSREASLRADLLQAVGESRTGLAVRAVEAQREAAVYERERATLEARLSVLQPEAEQVQREIDSLTTRIGLLESSRERMQTLDQAMRDQAAEDLRLSAQVAEQIASDLTALDDMRERDLGAAWDAAARGYEQAIASMRQASSGASRDGRTDAMIATGSLQQRLAEVLGARARGQDRYHSLLMRLLEAEPALPNASTMSQYLQRVRRDVGELEQAAAGSYDDARSSFEQSGARGELATRIDALVEQLSEPVEPTIDGDADEQS